MKLASLPHDNSLEISTNNRATNKRATNNRATNKRDGRLIVVSKDLKSYANAHHIAPNMQSALDNWQTAEPLLRALSDELENGKATSYDFDETQALPPLPRAYGWADGSAYVNHVELVRKARGATMPESFWHDPLMYQGGAECFLAPRAPIAMQDEAWGIDMEAEFAVIVDDVSMGADEQTAKQAIRLLALVNDVSLRGLIKDELAKGFGFFQSKPATAFSPVFVTPDELGDAWDGAKLHLTMRIDLNDEPLGRLETGKDMVFDMPQLIKHAAKTRQLCAGTIIGSGTISNKSETDTSDNDMGKPVSEGGAGYACLAELRMIETILHGAPKTSFMRFGDNVKIEMLDKNGQNIFGTIQQTVIKYQP